MVKTLEYFINNKFVKSKTTQYYEVYNPSTGEHIANMPRCTSSEVTEAIKAAHAAYLKWSQVPAIKRVQVLFKVRELIEKNIDELVLTLSTEHGKVLEEARGDVLKAKEAIEYACGIPSLLKGESLMDTSSGYDTVLYRESLGVFTGIAPFNFPAMIPMGWMVPLCIACGNTMVLKVSGATPMTALKIAELYVEAGLPDGVLNIVSCDRDDTQILLEHPLIKGVSFVGSTTVGKYIYETAAKNQKRVQALCEAKNHALVLADAPIERTAAGIVNAAFGCAGERCMALPVVVVEDSIADKLVNVLVAQAKSLKVGAAYQKTSELGPLYSKSHKENVIKWIEKGIKEGAKLVLDGRGTSVVGFDNGFYLGPTIFDNVKDDMPIGREEIFGPVLCIKRVKNFDEGLRLMNDSRFANGSVIYTQNGYYAREFSKRTHAGMVGINVGIPVPIGIFPFAGHKESFFGDLHCLGKDAINFFTESKCVTSHWFDENEIKKTKVSTWDGTI